MREIIIISIIWAALDVQTTQSFGLAEMISNYAKVVTNRQENANTTRYGIETYNTTNGNDTLEIVPDYDDFDDLEEDTNATTTRASVMDPGSILKFVNGMVNLVALISSFNKKPETAKPRGSLASEVNSLQDPVKYYPEAQERFHPDTVSKRFKMQSAKIANAIDQQFQPVETYPPYNPFSGTNAETYNKDNPKTSYDADNDQYKPKKNPMNSYMSNNVEIQPSYSYEVPYQPPKMKKPMQEASMGMGGDDNAGYQSYQPAKMKYPMQESPMDMADDDTGGYDAYQQDDSYQMNDMDSMPPKPKYPVYESWQHHGDMDYKPKKPKRPIYDDSDDADADADSDDDMDQPPKKSKHPVYAFNDDQSRKPSNSPADDFPVYYSHDHKMPINYHDFHLDHDFPDHHPPPPPPEEDHKMEEDRESKRPYSYYHLGRKLWYLPLLFSVYFIIYIGSLVLKSLARHKIQFPEKLWDLHDSHDTHHTHDDEHRRRNRRINDVTGNVVNAIENAKNKYM